MEKTFEGTDAQLTFRAPPHPTWLTGSGEEVDGEAESQPHRVCRYAVVKI